MSFKFIRVHLHPFKGRVVALIRWMSLPKKKTAPSLSPCGDASRSRAWGCLSVFTLVPPTNYRFNLIPCDATCATVINDAPHGTETRLRTFQPDLGVIWDGWLWIYDAREMFMEMNPLVINHLVALLRLSGVSPACIYRAAPPGRGWGWRQWPPWQSGGAWRVCGVWPVLWGDKVYERRCERCLCVHRTYRLKSFIKKMV